MLSVIWNITAKCPFECAFCAMDASPYCSRLELCLTEKLNVVNNLIGTDCRVDISGGEVMLNRHDHLPVIPALSNALGKERVGISCSGAYINDEIAFELSTLVKDVEMTMDANPIDDFTRRPTGYHATAAKATDILVRHGVSVSLQTVLTRDHFENPKLLDSLYQWMQSHGVSSWSLLRFFLSGRGANFPELELSDVENLELVDRAKALCANNPDFLDISYQLPGTPKDTDCRCVRKSVGITPTGDVIACFWAVDGMGRPNPDYLLGNLVHDRLADVISSPKAQHFCSYMGKCPL